MVRGTVACLCPPPATSVGSHSAGMGAGRVEPGLSLTLWICPRPRDEEEKEEQEVRVLHGASGKCAGASVAGRRSGHRSRDCTLLRGADPPVQLWWSQCHGAALVANEAGAEVLGRA